MRAVVIRNMSNISYYFKKNMRQYAMLLALVAIVIFFQVVTRGTTLKPINVQRLLMQNSYILILAIGMLMCILTGGNIDLSVGSIVALVSATSALFSIKMGIPVSLSILLSIVCGILVGMWQGYWIAYVKIPSFIVTLAGMLIFRGLNNLILNGKTIALPNLYVIIASGTIPDIFTIEGVKLHMTTLFIGIFLSITYVLLLILSRKKKREVSITVSSIQLFMLKLTIGFSFINFSMLWLALAGGLPYILIILGVIVGIYSFITNKTVLGRHIYATGGNAKTAQLSGIKTKKILFMVYANMGMLAAVAGIVFAGRLNSSSPVAGVGFELDAIAACFIGGASATGGVGTVFGAIIGGLIMGILNNGMSFMGLSIFWQSIVKGLVLLGAVAFDVYSKSKVQR